MKFNILTIFPEFFSSYRETGIIRSAGQKGLISIDAHDIRDFSEDRHRTVDDAPFGGGSGMVMKATPIITCIRHVRSVTPPGPVIFLTPRGTPLTQKIVKNLSLEKNLILVCARYEGADERILDDIDMEISIGDYILGGGEPAAIVLMDAISRLIEGVLGNETSLLEETFNEGLLEYPQFTRPESLPAFLTKQTVPEILLSGNHAEVTRWRRLQSIILTHHRRPDLLGGARLTTEEKDFLKKYSGGKLSKAELKFLNGNSCTEGKRKK